MSKKARSAVKVAMSKMYPYGTGRRKSPYDPVMGGTDGFGWYGGSVVERVNAAAWYVESRMSEMAAKHGKDGYCPKCLPVVDFHRFVLSAAIEQMGQEASIVRYDWLVTNSRYWTVWMSMVSKDIIRSLRHRCPMGL